MSVRKNKAERRKRNLLRQKMKPFVARYNKSLWKLLALVVLAVGVGIYLWMALGELIGDTLGSAGAAIWLVMLLGAVLTVYVWMQWSVSKAMERNHLCCAKCGAEVIFVHWGRGAAREIETIQSRYPGWEPDDETPIRCHNCGAFIEDYLADEIMNSEPPA